MNKRISGYRQSETMQGTISARTPESPVLQCLLFLGYSWWRCWWKAHLPLCWPFRI